VDVRSVLTSTGQMGVRGKHILTSGVSGLRMWWHLFFNTAFLFFWRTRDFSVHHSALKISVEWFPRRRESPHLSITRLWRRWGGGANVSVRDRGAPVFGYTKTCLWLYIREDGNFWFSFITSHISALFKVKIKIKIKKCFLFTKPKEKFFVYAFTGTELEQFLAYWEKYVLYCHKLLNAQ